MCGITGVYRLDGADLLLDAGRLDSMTDCMKHRGPDERGTKVFRAAALGHRRLKVLDLTAGQQPMGGADDKPCLVFNGEVYNFRELRVELEALGYQFESTSDTEVIYQAYVAWGDKCFDRFNGQFAIAIYEPGTHRIILARDRLGIKPLYYTVHGGCLVFGSEIKSILAYGDVPRRMNPRALTSYLGFRYVLGEETWFDGIRRLLPGHVKVWNDGKERLERYWEIPRPTADDVPDDRLPSLIAETRERVSEAVRKRMVADVPLGAYLSGGLDSSAIVAAMASEQEGPVKTFCVGFEDDEAAEFDFARMVAERCNTEHREVRLDIDDYLELLPRLIRFKDEPLSVPNEVPLHVMSTELKKHITVVLSGEGADELFAGYGRIFRSALDYQRWSMLRDQAPPQGSPEHELLGRLREACHGARSECEHFLSQYAYTSLDDQRELFTDQYINQIDGDVGLATMWAAEFEKLAGLAYEDKIRCLFQRYHIEGLLLRVDMTTLSTAVEARVPFLDHELIEWVLGNLPYSVLNRWKSNDDEARARFELGSEISEQRDITKYPLREAFKDMLPKPVIERKKVGFPVPLDDWLSGPLGNFARDILLDDRTLNRGYFRPETIKRWLDGGGLKSRRGQIIWMLVNAELWNRMYIDEAEQ